MLTNADKSRNIHEVINLTRIFGNPPLTNVDLFNLNPKNIDVIVVGSIINRIGKIVLVQRKNHPYWLIPGGVIESKESISEGTLREVKEETGLNIQIDRILRIGFEPNYSPIEFQQDNVRRFGKKNVSLLYINFSSTALSGNLDCSLDPKRSITTVKEFETIPFSKIAHVYKVLFIEQGIVEGNLSDYSAVGFTPSDNK